MATTHLTTEEAAARLDITVEEFKRRLKTDPLFKDLERGKIRDGTSFRYKETAVEELSRELGAGSNPGNSLPTVNLPSHQSADFKVDSAGNTPSKAKPKDEPLVFDSDDIFSLAADEPGSAAPLKSKPDSDSDVRLEEKAKAKGKVANEEDAIPTEEVVIDLGESGSAVIKGGSSAKLSAPKSSGKLTTDSGKSLAKPGTGESSEFELSLDADSDDFELKLNADASDEVDLGEMPKESPGGSGRRGTESGILSRKPNDSGHSLEKDKGKSKLPIFDEDSNSDVDFELTLDSSAAVSGTKIGSAKGKVPETDSDSEFELTLDDSSESSLESAMLEEGGPGKGDIFETDFEIPPMDDSSSEEVALESSDPDLETSDFDIEIDEESGVEAEAESGEVALVEGDDSEDVDLADVDLAEEEESVGGALKGVKSKRRDDDDDEDEEETVAAGAGAYRPVPWGIVPTLFLVPAFVLTLVGGLMAYEVLQTMWGYQQPQKPASPLVRGLAKSLDMELRDQ